MVAAIYVGFKPHPSLLVLRHPFAGHALGFGEFVGGLLLGDPISIFLRQSTASRVYGSNKTVIYSPFTTY